MYIVERFWRTIKYEDIYFKSYGNPVELEKGIRNFIWRYEYDRPHQQLFGMTPEELFINKMVRAA